MGYDTIFDGAFTCTPPLTEAQCTYLKKFNETRRMRRVATLAAELLDSAREAVRLPIGADGGYFVGGYGCYGQGTDPSVVDGNKPPEGQPGLWCQWRPTDDGRQIVWDRGEKFDHYTDWLKYLIQHFLIPWGVSLTGAVRWQGARSEDFGTITVACNAVAVRDRELLTDWPTEMPDETSDAELVALVREVLKDFARPLTPEEAAAIFAPTPGEQLPQATVDRIMRTVRAAIRCAPGRPMSSQEPLDA